MSQTDQEPGTGKPVTCDYCRVETGQEGVASNLTITYTKPGDGITTTYDLGTVKWNAPQYEEVNEWEAHLCARDGQVLLITEAKAPWYARLFARLLGLEWQWVEVTNTQVAYGGQVLAWTPCVAGEDLPLGSVVVNNNGVATEAK